uniref:Chitin-binding type-2 domain-containing protein n=1 Tax=Strongyloides venezuelensis TaxID=75913 RepID=A0A0K0FFD5_STRVS
MVWRIIFLSLIFCNNFFVNSFSPPGIVPQILEPSVKYEQEHRPVISRDGSLNVPKSPYEPPSSFYATRPPLPGYYQATQPFTRGPFPYVPVTASPIKIELKNPQDLLEEIKSNGYYGENESNTKKIDKIVSNTGIFYPVQKTENGDMVGYVNVAYYEIPATQSVTSQKIMILDHPSTTTTTTTTTRRSTTTTIKSTTTTKPINIPEVYESEQPKVVTTSYLPTTQSTFDSYPAVDISKNGNVHLNKPSIQLPKINKFNFYQNTNSYQNYLPKSNGYEAIPISPEMYNSNYNTYNINNKNILQPSPPMTGGYYGPIKPIVTQKKTNTLTPMFTRTRPHLATINPITEENIYSIVSKIKSKKTTILPTIAPYRISESTISTEYATYPATLLEKVTRPQLRITSSTRRPMVTSPRQEAKFEETYQTIPTEYATYPATLLEKVTRPHFRITSSTRRPMVTTQREEVKFEETYRTISPKRPTVTTSRQGVTFEETHRTISSIRPKITQPTKGYSSTFVPPTSQPPRIIASSTTKPQIITFPRSTEKILTYTPSTSRTTPSIVIFEKSTKMLPHSRLTPDISSVKFLSTTPSTEKVEQGVTFGETKKLDKEEMTNVRGNVKFEHETYVTPRVKVSTTEAPFERETKIETTTESFAIFEEHTKTTKHRKIVTPKYTTVQIEPSAIENEEIEVDTPKKVPHITEVGTSTLPTIQPSIFTGSTYPEKPRITTETSTLPSRPETVTSRTSQTTKKIATPQRIEPSSVPFIPEHEIFETLPTQKPFEEHTPTEKVITMIPATEKEHIESTTTKEINKPALESSTIKGTIPEITEEEELSSEATTTSRFKIEHTTVPFIPEGELFETLSTKGPSEEHLTTDSFGTKIQTKEKEFSESTTAKEIEQPSLETLESEGTTINTFTELPTEIGRTTSGISIEPITLESTTLTIPQLHSESLFPEEVEFEKASPSTSKTTGFQQGTEEVTTESIETTKASFETFETTSISPIHVESTILPTEIPETSTLPPTEPHETTLFPFETVEPSSETTIHTTLEIEASTTAFTTTEVEVSSTQSPEVEIVPFTPTEGLFAFNETTESTPHEKIIVDFDSATVSKNLTELCSTTELVMTNETEVVPSKETESHPTEFIVTPTELSEETTIIPVEILFPTETIVTERFPETTTIQPTTVERVENETLSTTVSEGQQTTTPPKTSTISIEIPTEERTTTEEEMFPTDFPTEATTSKTTSETIPSLPPNVTTAEEEKEKLIKSVTIIDGKKKISVIREPETPGVEFISPNMTITKTLDKSTNKLVPNGKNGTKNNLVSIQITTDMEKSVKLEDTDFEEALEKELGELIPKILETLEKEEKEGKELGETLETGIGKELEKEIKNKDDVGKENSEEFSKNNQGKSFIDRDYPDFDPSKDKVVDSSMVRNDDSLIKSCPEEPFVPSEPPTDVMFMVDGTKSMSGENFIHSLKMMGDFVMKFNNIGPNGTQFSLVQYTSQPFFEFSFKKHACRDDILRDIIETSYMKGNNNTNNLDVALDKINKFGFSYLRGDRPEAKNFLIIFNGNEEKNDNIGSAIEELKKNDVEVFAVCEDEGSENVFKDVLPGDNIMSMKNDKKTVDRISDNIKKSGSRKGNGDEIKMIKIDCKNNELRVVLEVPKSYQGIFTTKNHLNDSTCSRKVPLEIGHGNKQLGFIFKKNECGLDIVHNNKLNGNNYSISMNIFKDDREIGDDNKDYLVQCFSPNKDIENNGKKSVFDGNRTDVEPPTCQYSLHRDSIDGPIVNLAVIGQTIYHKWECHGGENIEDYYEMFIHKCFVGTYDKKNIFKMVDDDGCSTKNATIDSIIYDNDKMIAYAKSQVFSLEDIEHLKFSCKIGLCSRKNGDCDKITPPQCNNTDENSISNISRQDRQINPTSHSFEDDVETDLQIIESFRFGSQKLVNNNDIFNYKDLEQPVIPIMLITLIISLSIFIIITVYKKYKHPIYAINEDDNIFSNSYASSIINNGSRKNSNKTNIDHINFEDEKLHHINYTLIDFHKKSSNI